MKKIVLLSLMSVFLFSCENFLDTESFTKANTGNYPTSPAQAENMLAGVYSVLKRGLSSSVMFRAEILSDNRFGSAGDSGSDVAFHAINKHMEHSSYDFGSQWSEAYSAIFRANSLISAIDNVTWENNTQLYNKILGEAYFLRAYFYSTLAKCFGPYIPLVLTPDPIDAPPASIESVYGQIMSDFKKAIELIPSTEKYQGENIGHATKYAAQAFMAREFLFYTGYYGVTSAPCAGSEDITKDYIIDQLDDCINNSGHKLVPKFWDLWPYGNKWTGNSYKYNADNNVSWVGLDGNTEDMFSIRFDLFSPSEWAANAFGLYFGVRNNEKCFPFDYGWGAGQVNPKFVEDWKNDPYVAGDIRINATIFDATNKAVEGDYVDNYVKGGNGWGMAEETMLFDKKNLAVNVKDADDPNKFINFSVVAYNASKDRKMNNMSPIILMRFSDVLLMHSELTETPEGLNLVRERVGLPSVAYSLDNIKKERRYELALEIGIRYYDILRWYGKDHLKEAGEELDRNQEGALMYHNGIARKMEGMDLKNRLPETGGFFAVPQDQVDLSESLKQNPGWLRGEHLFRPY